MRETIELSAAKPQSSRSRCQVHSCWPAPGWGACWPLEEGSFPNVDSLSSDKSLSQQPAGLVRDTEQSHDLVRRLG